VRLVVEDPPELQLGTREITGQEVSLRQPEGLPDRRAEGSSGTRLSDGTITLRSHDLATPSLASANLGRETLAPATEAR
jgi:hypothetical protein